MYVSDRCQIDADLLRSRLDQLRRNPEERHALLQAKGTTTKKVVEEQPPPSTRPKRLDPSLRPGLEALRIAVHFPERVANRLEPALFLDPVQRRSFEALLEAESLQAAVDDADAEVAALLRQLIVDEPVVEVNELGDPVEASIAQLVRTAARRSLDRLTARSRVEPTSLGALNTEAAKVKRLMELLEAPATTASAEAALVTWITEQEGA